MQSNDPETVSENLSRFHKPSLKKKTRREQNWSNFQKKKTPWITKTMYDKKVVLKVQLRD